MTEAALQQYIQTIRPADRAVMDAARERQAELAKPPGSLGALEDMSIRLAGITGQVCPKMGKCRVAVFAADNGVVDEGVSCAPRSVTLQQAINMTRRRTGMSAMAAAFVEQTAIIQEISSNAQRTAHLTAEVAHTIDEVNGGAKLTTDAAAQVHISAHQRTGQSQRLASEVERLMTTLAA